VAGGGARMPNGIMPSVGDRVNARGHEGVFLILQCDDDKRTVSLLPSDNGKILDDIPVDQLTILPRPEPNGATRV